MTLEWPQILMIVWIMVSGIVYFVRNGKPRSEYRFINWAFDAAVLVGLLIAGGFFK